MRKQVSGLRRRRIMPVTFKFCDDLSLTSDDVFAFGDMPFSLAQALLQLGAIRHQKFPFSIRFAAGHPLGKRLLR